MPESPTKANSGDRWATDHFAALQLGDWSSYAYCSCGWNSGEVGHPYSPYTHLNLERNPARGMEKAHLRKMGSPLMRFTRRLYQGFYRGLDRHSHGFYRSFDCKGGHHGACETCGCRCHDIKMY